jgi:hypothetical protein
MHFASFLQWLAATPFSNFLLTTTWAEPIIETAHVLTLTLFLGFAVLLDLRLLGVLLVNRPVSEVLGQINRWLIVGYIIMIVTGILLFCGDPVSFWSTAAFKLKMIMLVLAGMNVMIFNWTIGRKIDEWDMAAKTPIAAKTAGIISLALWIAIVAAGRVIAYTIPLPV